VPEAGHQGGFLPHYLDKLVYPGNSANLLTIAGVLVCVAKPAFYGPNVDQPARSSLKMQRIPLAAFGQWRYIFRGIDLRTCAVYCPEHAFPSSRKLVIRD
jgi:hypothetical protein